MSTEVKWISNLMRGAPGKTNAAGSELAIIDALLLTGWGATTALSVTVASGIATASLTPGQTFLKDAVVLVSGATPSEVNGESRVMVSTNTSITWATTAADGVATGTITIKYAPQGGWTKVFSATNKAVYRSDHPDSAGHCLRVDDSATSTYCRVRGFESMTDLDTGTGPFPTDAQASGGGYWEKAMGTTPTPYRYLADSRTMLRNTALYFANGATYISAPLRGFGDMIPLSPSGDVWSTALSCLVQASVVSSAGSFDGASESSFSNGGAAYTPRGFSAIGGSKMVDARAHSGIPGGMSGAGALQTYGAIPSPVDGKVRTSKLFLREQGNSSPARADIPGVLYLPHNGVLSEVNDGDFFDGAGDLAGHRLLVVAISSQSSQPILGAYCLDVTGPWR